MIRKSKCSELDGIQTFYLLLLYRQTRYPLHCQSFGLGPLYLWLYPIAKWNKTKLSNALHCACIVSLLCATYKGGEQKLDALASAVSLDLYYSKSECEKALLRVVWNWDR